MDGLIVKQPYANWILKGNKKIELRSSNTLKKNERIAIIESGTNYILGYVTIVDSVELLEKDFIAYKNEHLIELSYENVLKVFGYKKIFGWKLDNPVFLEQPMTCQNRKKGQVIWVKNAC